MNWNLDIFYTNLEKFNSDLIILNQKIEGLSKLKGTLNTLNGLKTYYQKEEDVIKLLYPLYAYAHLASDLNLKDDEKTKRMQQVMIALNNLNQSTSFVSPELISIGEKKILSFIDSDNFLKNYTFPLQQLFFLQKHTLDDNQERILANFSTTRSIPSNLYNALAIIDSKDEVITLSNKKEVTVTLSNYRSLLPNVATKEDRKLVFEAAFKRFKDNKNVFANIYNLVLQNLAANYKSRNYSSALGAALFKNNIPLSVYTNLMDTAHDNTNLIKRYINIRKKYLNIDEYHTYDRFLNITKDDNKYPYDKAKTMFFDAIKHLDAEYQKNEIEALKDGFVDVLPVDGKRTGAYSSCFYGYHPYILLNHDDTLDSVFTLAHEAGHSAHSIFANEHQPISTADYTIFVAEIASTFNEHVLLDHLLKNAKDKNQKIALLESAIDGIMGTFYRQTLFATYEYEANKLVQDGNPINAENLSQIMINLYKHYYDIDIKQENGKECVWAYIPHLFHTPFYVYQYATSYSASLKFYEDVKNDKPNAMKNFLDLLKSGGSDFPINLVKKAGVDLTDKSTFTAVINRFKDLLDQLEDSLK